jgi:hypothetical protein
MASIEFFERFAGAFLLWFAALMIALYSFVTNIPFYMAMSLNSTGLFLVFFLTWGLVFTFFYALVALYFTAADMFKGTKVPAPSHRTRKGKK